MFTVKKTRRKEKGVGVIFYCRERKHEDITRQIECVGSRGSILIEEFVSGRDEEHFKKHIKKGR